MTAIAPPLGLLAELTHRCPLRCVYCSNPLDLVPRAAELDTAAWRRVFAEAADLGVLHVHLSGGEPLRRDDIVELTRSAADAGLYTNMITSGAGLAAGMLERLADAGLDHVQLSLQDTLAGEGDAVAGRPGAQAEKRDAARIVTEAGLPLTINVVLNRANAAHAAALIDEAVALGARRIELAHTQYLGWAALNHAALMPTRADVERVAATVEAARARYDGVIVIDAVAADYFGTRPKPCMNGWGRESMTVAPDGHVLPCHAAQTIAGLEFWNVTERTLADIWHSSPAFDAFRGTAWMREPCTSCPLKAVDHGGCRCQAFALTGDARNADPACALSPHHETIAALRDPPPEHRDRVTYRQFGGRNRNQLRR